MEPKNRCCGSEISMSGDIDAVSKALIIPEILIRLVEHLCVDDVINFRLVCKLWNEYCDPKFVFRTFDFPSLDITALQSGCQRLRRLNLELQDCELDSLPVEIWKIWGPKLRSLRIYRCYFTIETLQSIISNCIRLEVLEIVPRLTPVDFSFFHELLDYFIGRRERHTRLRTLSIEGGKFAEISEFSKILTVFPCIESFGCNIRGICDNVSKLHMRSCGNYDMRKLRSYAMLSGNDLWSTRPVAPILDSQLLRLTIFKSEFQFTIFSDDLKRRERFFHFFTTQKDLKAIDILVHLVYPEMYRSEDVSVFTKSLIFHILKTCSNLQEFCVRESPRIREFGFRSIKLTNNESREFFSLISNLQSLQLSYNFEKNVSETTTLPSLLPSPSCCVLQLSTKEADFFSILKLSPGLKVLDTEVYSDERLREIIIAMPNIEILRLRLFGCTNYGFTGENEESSFRRLQKLKYLRIIDDTREITQEVFDEFRFPHLEFLELYLQYLPDNFSNMPNLKTLNLGVMTGVTELQKRKSLSNLKHVIVYELNDRYDTAKLYLLFKSFPKLRTVISCRSKVVLLFNRLSGEISHIKHLSNLEIKLDGLSNYNL